MMKLKNFAFFLFILLVSGIVSLNGETVENSDIFLNMVIELVNDVCSSIDECKMECCQLNKLYYIAKKNCRPKYVIDRQLSHAKWKEPFSADHKLSCKSVCSERIDYEQKIHDQEFQGISQSKDLCNKFIEVCYNYTSLDIHFDNLEKMDYFRRYWLPVIGMSSSILLLSFTLILYLLVPELCNRLQDKCFLFNLSSQIINRSMYLIVMNSDELEESFLCQSYGKPALIIFLNAS